MIEVLTRGPANAPVGLIFAHGAGAPMTSPFLEALSTHIAGRGIAISRFEFAYMCVRRQGKRRPPPKAELLIGEFIDAVEQIRTSQAKQRPLVIGGKSMGGRVASMVAEDLYNEGKIAGLAVAGYPFHPPGRPQTPRVAHLAAMTCPGLIVQGDRDPFGRPEEISGYALPNPLSVTFVPGGDHDMRTPRGHYPSSKQALMIAAEAIAEFCLAVAKRKATAKR
jgi:hypothetical protein